VNIIIFFLFVQEKNTVIEAYTIKLINRLMKLLWFVQDGVAFVLPLVWR